MKEKKTIIHDLPFNQSATMLHLTPRPYENPSSLPLFHCLHCVALDCIGSGHANSVIIRIYHPGNSCFVGLYCYSGYHFVNFIEFADCSNDDFTRTFQYELVFILKQCHSTLTPVNPFRNSIRRLSSRWIFLRPPPIFKRMQYASYDDGLPEYEEPSVDVKKL